jgi:hypothetical protein
MSHITEFNQKPVPMIEQPQIVVFVWSPWSHVHLGVSVDIGINSFSSLTL